MSRKFTVAVSFELKVGEACLMQPCKDGDQIWLGDEVFSTFVQKLLDYATVYIIVYPPGGEMAAWQKLYRETIEPNAIVVDRVLPSPDIAIEVAQAYKSLAIVDQHVHHPSRFVAQYYPQSMVVRGYSQTSNMTTKTIVPMRYLATLAQARSYRNHDNPDGAGMIRGKLDFEFATHQLNMRPLVDVSFQGIKTGERGLSPADCDILSEVNINPVRRQIDGECYVWGNRRLDGSPVYDDPVFPKPAPSRSSMKEGDVVLLNHSARYTIVETDGECLKLRPE